MIDREQFVILTQDEHDMLVAQLARDRSVLLSPHGLGVQDSAGFDTQIANEDLDVPVLNFTVISYPIPGVEHEAADWVWDRPTILTWLAKGVALALPPQSGMLIECDPDGEEMEALHYPDAAPSPELEGLPYIVRAVAPPQPQE